METTDERVCSNSTNNRNHEKSNSNSLKCLDELIHQLLHPQTAVDQLNPQTNTQRDSISYTDDEDDEYEYYQDSDRSTTPCVSDLDDLASEPLTPEPQHIESPTPIHSDNYELQPINISLSQLPDSSARDSYDEDDLDDDSYDVDEYEEINLMPSNDPSFGFSQSWTRVTMTRRYSKSTSIKCITPISQQMAEKRISNSKDFRRKSVAFIEISDFDHIELDEDLKKIVNEFECKTSQEKQMSHDRE